MGAAVLLSRFLAPAISAAAALHLLCFGRAAQVVHVDKDFGTLPNMGAL